MNKESRIYVAGHGGLVGKAVCSEFAASGYENIVTESHAALDLRDQEETWRFFQWAKPEYVVLAAAKVGGIGANATLPADFLYDNIMIAANVISCSHKSGVKRLVNLGSSCIYPRMAPQPLREEYLLTGELEKTNEAYAVAKIAAVKMCMAFNTQYGTDFRSLMPTNLYGPGDNYDSVGSHVLPAMIRKFHEAKVNGHDVVLWGDGSPKREFLYSRDLARAVVRTLTFNGKIEDLVNVGSGEELTIRELAGIVSAAVGYEGGISWDTSKPNGTPRKLLDSSRIAALGWAPETDLKTGVGLAYEAFLKAEARGTG